MAINFLPNKKNGDNGSQGKQQKQQDNNEYIEWSEPESLKNHEDYRQQKGLAQEKKVEKNSNVSAWTEKDKIRKSRKDMVEIIKKELSEKDKSARNIDVEAKALKQKISSKNMAEKNNLDLTEKKVKKEISGNSKSEGFFSMLKKIFSGKELKEIRSKEYEHTKSEHIKDNNLGVDINMLKPEKEVLIHSNKQESHTNNKKAEKERNRKEQEERKRREREEQKRLAEEQKELEKEEEKRKRERVLRAHSDISKKANKFSLGMWLRRIFGFKNKRALINPRVLNAQPLAVIVDETKKSKQGRETCGDINKTKEESKTTEMLYRENYIKEDEKDSSNIFVAEKEVKDAEDIVAKEIEKEENKIKDSKKKNNGRVGEKQVEKWEAPSILDTNLIKNEVPAGFDWGKNLTQLFIFTIMSALIVGGSYWRLYEWGAEKESQINQLIERNEELKNKVVVLEEDNQEAINFKSKLSLVNQILEKHIRWSKLFNYFEENTLADVYLVDFRGGIDGVYKLNGRARNFSLVDAQLRQYRSSEYTKIANINEASIKAEVLTGVNSVDFLIDLAINPLIFIN